MPPGRSTRAISSHRIDDGVPAHDQIERRSRRTAATARRPPRPREHRAGQPVAGHRDIGRPRFGGDEHLRWPRDGGQDLAPARLDVECARRRRPSAPPSVGRNPRAAAPLWPDPRTRRSPILRRARRRPRRPVPRRTLNCCRRSAHSHAWQSAGRRRLIQRGQKAVGVVGQGPQQRVHLTALDRRSIRLRIRAVGQLVERRCELRCVALDELRRALLVPDGRFMALRSEANRRSDAAAARCDGRRHDDRRAVLDTEIALSTADFDC